MNVPHDRICPNCTSHMYWCKDHYECPECGHIGRKMWRWKKTAVILTILIIVSVVFYQFVLA